MCKYLKNDKIKIHYIINVANIFPGVDSLINIRDSSLFICPPITGVTMNLVIIRRISKFFVELIDHIPSVYIIDDKNADFKQL